MTQIITSAANVPTEATLSLLTKLIGFDTVSRNSNLELIAFLRDYLQELGATCRLTYDRDQKKANLFATLGEGKGFGTVFSGHTDVVPVDGQDWLTDPFKATVIGDKLFGRGSCDMKGFIAVCLSRIKQVSARDLQVPVHFSFSYDEELGCLGVRGLLDDLAANGISPTGCIVGEPTMMQPIIAHKGKRAYRCCVHGHAAHSSVPLLGINAVDFAAELIVKLRQMAQHLRYKGAQDGDYDVPFSSIAATVIHGGNAVNTIPEKCEFIFEHRFLPGADPQQLLDELSAYAQDVLLPQMKVGAHQGRVEFEILSAYPGLNSGLNDPLVKTTMQLLETQYARKVGFGTEGGLFSAAGIPAIICGPGDIAQAHKPNEFVSLQQLARCEAFFDDFIKTTCLVKPA
jgi:acetylornithine deacetylase